MNDAFLEVTGWEYTTLRKEIEECYRHAFQIYSWGTGLLLALLIAIGQGYLRYEFLLFLAMPSAFVLGIIWLGQLVRIARAGRYLRFVEAKVSEYIGVSRPDLRTFAQNMRDRQTKWESELKAIEFGYDFSRVLNWETWLSSERGKSPAAGHLGWLYSFQVIVFPGVFMICPFLYVWLSDSAKPWYVLCAELVILELAGLYWLGKRLQLV